MAFNRVMNLMIIVISVKCSSPVQGAMIVRRNGTRARRVYIFVIIKVMIVIELREGRSSNCDSYLVHKCSGCCEDSSMNRRNESKSSDKNKIYNDK